MSSEEFTPESWSPTLQFILECADRTLRGFTSPIAKPEFSGSSEGWAEVLQLAETLEVLPAVCQAVGLAPWKEEIPTQVLFGCLEKFKRARLMQAVLDEELLQVLAILQHHKIPMVLLGAVEWKKRYAFKSLGQTPQPLALMIPGQDLTFAVRALTERGYLRAAKQAPGLPFVSLSQSKEKTNLRIHSSLISGKASGLDETFWTEARGGLIPGLPLYCQTISTEESFLFRIHEEAVEKQLSSLSFLYECAELLKKASLDWDRFCHRAACERLSTVSWVTFKILNSLEPALIPASVLLKLESQTPLLRRRALYPLANFSFWLKARVPGANFPLMTHDGALAGFRQRLRNRGSSLKLQDL